LENRSGRLAEVANTLGAADINIRALCVADTSEFGIVRLIAADAVKAVRVLREAGFAVREAEVFAVEVPDVPGALAKVLNVLAQAGINVEYSYAYGPVEGTGKAVLMFRVADEALAAAAQAFERAQVRTLSEEELARL